MVQPLAQQLKFQLYSKIVGCFLGIAGFIRVSRTEKLAEKIDFKKHNQLYLADTHIAKTSYDRVLSSTKLPKIYTKTGDKGTSAAFTGERRNKDDDIFHALGNTDELSCCIGLAREYSINNGLKLVEKLENIQCVLQDVASNIATPKSSAREAHIAKTTFSAENTKDLERWIDEYTEKLPPLKNFILPSGGKTSCVLHMARSICRRAERSLVPLVRCDEMDGEPARYLNRLSDFLFTAARLAAQMEGKSEKIYHRMHPEKENNTS